ncbi:MAG: PAS domain-containing protein [Pseudomonadota bacterium]
MIDLHPEHARAVLEAFPIGVFLTDANGQIMWMNRLMREQCSFDLKHFKKIGRHETTMNRPLTCLSDDGRSVVIESAYTLPSGDGFIVLVIERGNALVWFLNALSNGTPVALAATGMQSATTIKMRLQNEISRSRRYGNPLSVLYLSCQRREDLEKIALTVKSELRWVDQIGQWDEQSILVLMPESNANAADALAFKLTEAINAAGYDNPQRGYGCGFATWRRGDTPETMIANAQLLSRQSNQGRTAAH